MKAAGAASHRDSVMCADAPSTDRSSRKTITGGVRAAALAARAPPRTYTNSDTPRTAGQRDNPGKIRAPSNKSMSMNRTLNMVDELAQHKAKPKHEPKMNRC